MPVGVGVVGEGDVEGVALGDQAGHRIGRRAVHADLAVPIDGHEREGRIDLGVDHAGGQAIALDQGRPVVDRRPAQRIDADAHPGAGDRLHVHDVGQVGDIGGDVVVGLDTGALAGALIGEAHHPMQAAGQDGVGGVLDPAGDVGVGRPAMAGIIFEAAILGRVVRGTDDDAVRQAARATLVVGQDGVGDHRRRRIAAGLVDHGGDAIGRQHLDGAGEGWLGQAMGVHAQEQRPIDAHLLPVEADRLADRQDMRLVKRAGEGRTAVAGGAESDLLHRVFRVRRQAEIGRDQARRIDEEAGRRRLAGKGADAVAHGSSRGSLRGANASYQTLALGGARVPAKTPPKFGPMVTAS